jgi:hypothetical protein
MIARCCAALSVSVAIACTDGPSAPAAPAGSGPLTVTGVSPSRGSTAGSTPAQVIGTGFQSGATVIVDGAAVPATVVSPTIIAVTMPPHPAGDVDVVVALQSGQRASLAGGFSYIVVPAPRVISVEPATGSIDAEVPVLISGRDFQPGAAVSIGGVVAYAFVRGSTEIHVRTRARESGSVTVSVINPDGQRHDLVGGFAFTEPQSFEIDGDWDGGAWNAGVSEHLLFRLQIRNDAVVSVACSTAAVVTLARPVPVAQGRFTYAGERITLTGRVLSPVYAEGTIDVAQCAKSEWAAVRKPGS